MSNCVESIWPDGTRLDDCETHYGCERPFVWYDERTGEVISKEGKEGDTGVITTVSIQETAYSNSIGDCRTPSPND